MREMIEIRGKRLYVEMHGSEQNPALLYLHGGPGSSCYDFIYFQKERLMQNLRVIAMDQRGVLRSEAIRPNEPFGLKDLVEDCEALRKYVGAKTWSVSGHSFGGALAVHYALSYPESIDRLILECPGLDLDLTLRSHLRAMSLEYLSIGKYDEAKACLKAANECNKKDAFDAFNTLRDSLGDRWEPMHIHGSEKRVFSRIFGEASFTEEHWKRSGTHIRRLFEDGVIFESLLPLLHQIKHPTLLIKGKYDLVTTDVQIFSFLENVVNGKVEIFDQSGHFPRIDEPDRYAHVVTHFIKSSPCGEPSCLSFR